MGNQPYEQPFCDWCVNGNQMNPRRGVSGGDDFCYRWCTGQVRFHLLTAALLALVGRPTTPRGYALRAVDRYRRWSAGRVVCPNPPASSCSTLGRAEVVRYGALRGTYRAWRIGRTCRSRWLAANARLPLDTDVEAKAVQAELDRRNVELTDDGVIIYLGDDGNCAVTL